MRTLLLRCTEFHIDRLALLSNKLMVCGEMQAVDCVTMIILSSSLHRLGSSAYF